MGFWIIVTIRSSSSDVSSPALNLSEALPISCYPSSPFVQIDVGFLADQIRVSPPHTLDFGQGVHNLLLAIDVGVEDSKDELDCGGVSEVHSRN